MMADKPRRTTSQREAVAHIRDAEGFAVELPLVGKVTVPRPEQLAYYGGWRCWRRSRSSTGRSPLRWLPATFWPTTTAARY